MTRRPLHSKVETIVGLDLSLRAAAACALPRGWNYDMKRVRTMVVGENVSNAEGEDARIRRLDKIASAIVAFCKSNHAIAIGVEDYAFSQGQSRAHALGELGGVVKLEIFKALGIAPLPIVASTARKTLLQRARVKGMKDKDYVIHNVQRLGPVAQRWTNDEIDAFVIANAMVERAGGIALTYEGEMP
jgi:Holliday junction resolvasome RuvABC endonuclease subunit